MKVVAAPYLWIEKDVRPRFPRLADLCLRAYEIANVAADSKSLDISRKQEMVFSYALLKDGYLIENLDFGAVRVTVARKRGITAQNYTANEVQEKGLTHIIEMLTSHANRY